MTSIKQLNTFLEIVKGKLQTFSEEEVYLETSEYSSAVFLKTGDETCYRFSFRDVKEKPKQFLYIHTYEGLGLSHEEKIEIVLQALKEAGMDLFILFEKNGANGQYEKALGSIKQWIPFGEKTKTVTKLIHKLEENQGELGYQIEENNLEFFTFTSREKRYDCTYRIGFSIERGSVTFYLEDEKYDECFKEEELHLFLDEFNEEVKAIQHVQKQIGHEIDYSIKKRPYGVKQAFFGVVKEDCMEALVQQLKVEEFVYYFQNRKIAMDEKRILMYKVAQCIYKKDQYAFAYKGTNSVFLFGKKYNITFDIDENEDEEQRKYEVTLIIKAGYEIYGSVECKGTVEDVSFNVVNQLDDLLNRMRLESLFEGQRSNSHIEKMKILLANRIDVSVKYERGLDETEKKQIEEYIYKYFEHTEKENGIPTVDTKFANQFIVLGNYMFTVSMAGKELYVTKVIK